MFGQSVVIIDYGLCNLDSVRRACEEQGAEAIVSNRAEHILKAPKLILPGVGNFSDAMKNMHALSLPPIIKEALLERKIPLLGICLGMQMLATLGEEGEGCEGLNLIPGRVKLLERDTPETRIPHVGWNNVDYKEGAAIFSGIPNSCDFYFVHSFHFEPADPNHILATTPYCGGFASAVRKDNIWGVQFHPEKSQRPGLRMLKNFLEL